MKTAGTLQMICAIRGYSNVQTTNMGFVYEKLFGILVFVGWNFS